jgi:Sigma-70, region 4
VNARNLFDRLLAGHPGYRIDSEQFWIVVEHLREWRYQPNLSCRELLTARYDRAGYAQATLEQIGLRRGITKERVRQKEAFALRQLREHAVFRMYAYRQSAAEMCPLEFPLPRPLRAARSRNRRGVFENLRPRPRRSRGTKKK